MTMKSWRLRFKVSREMESNFREYANQEVEVLNKASLWVREGGVFRFKVGADPFDKNKLEYYFSQYMWGYRSGLDQMVNSYAIYNQQNYKSSGFPIRDSHANLENRINGWRGWDQIHKQEILDFIEKHSPFYDSDTYSCLSDLSKLRNISEHQISIEPIPHVKADIGLAIPMVNGGKFTVHPPIGHEGSISYNMNSGEEFNAKFGEYYGNGYSSPDIPDGESVIAQHLISVRFEALDPNDSNFDPVDVLLFMTKLSKAMNKIEDDFMSKFSYI
ncbi:hypothetical protein [Rothia sp. 110740021-2]